MQDGKVIRFCCLWVNDLICGLSENFCEWFYTEVSKKFEFSDYSDLTWILDMKIERSSEMKFIPAKYIEKIINL